MTIQPSFYFHFEVKKDYRACCPRVFLCCRHKNHEYIASKNGQKLIKTSNAPAKKRAKTQELMLYNMIPERVGYENWAKMAERVERIAEIKFDDLIKEGTPLTKELLFKIGRAIDIVFYDSIMIQASQKK